MLKNIFNLQIKFVIFLSRPNRNLFVTFQQEMYHEKCFFQRENSEVVYFENGFFKQVEKKRFVRVSFGMRAFFLKQQAASSLARNIGKISFFTLFARYSTLCIFIHNVFVLYIYFQKPDFERFSRQSKKYLVFRFSRLNSWIKVFQAAFGVLFQRYHFRKNPPSSSGVKVIISKKFTTTFIPIAYLDRAQRCSLSN